MTKRFEGLYRSLPRLEPGQRLTDPEAVVRYCAGVDDDMLGVAYLPGERLCLVSFAGDRPPPNPVMVTPVLDAEAIHTICIAAALGDPLITTWPPVIKAVCLGFLASLGEFQETAEPQTIEGKLS